ncbi:hypothetical protein EON64_05545 [archaeon]|nr:MAG: hypothetical protein EON64_05545 [archaeon]
MRHLEEAVHALQQQLSVYGGKFDEFDETLNKSFSILKKVDERVESLDTKVQKLAQVQLCIYTLYFMHIHDHMAIFPCLYRRMTF